MVQARMSAASGGAEPPVEQLQAEMESLKMEIKKLRKDGTDVVEAYNRKKERADELLDALVAVKQECEEMAQKVEAMEQESSEAAHMLRVQEEELERLRRLAEAAEGAPDEAGRLLPTSSGLSEAAVVGALAEVGRWHEELMTVVDTAVQLVEESVRASSTRRGQNSADVRCHTTTEPRAEVAAVVSLLVERACDRGEAWMVVQVMAEEKRQAEEVWRSCEEARQECRESLMHDLVCLQDFAALERRVLQEEGEGLGHKIESLTVQLEGSQAVAEDMRAQALEQAERDARTIQELEVTVQLTEGALKLSEELPPRQDQDSLESLRGKLVETEEELGSTRQAVLVLQERLQEKERLQALEEKEKVRGICMDMERLEEEEEERLQLQGRAQLQAEARVKHVERLEEQRVKELAVGDKDREREDRLRDREGGAAASLPNGALRGTAEPPSQDCRAELQRLRSELGEVRRERDRANANYALLQHYLASRRMAVPLPVTVTVTGVGNEGPAGAVPLSLSSSLTGLRGGAGGRGREAGMQDHGVGVGLASKGPKGGLLMMPNQPSQASQAGAMGPILGGEGASRRPEEAAN